jgi:hypothetical protein
LDFHTYENQKTPALPGAAFTNNRIMISEQFAHEIERKPAAESICRWHGPTNPPCFSSECGWLTGCFTETGRSEIPLMGPNGLKAQLGVQGYDDPEQGARSFRNKVRDWLLQVLRGWPGCPARLESRPAGDYLIISYAKAINESAPGSGKHYPRSTPR